MKTKKTVDREKLIMKLNEFISIEQDRINAAFSDLFKTMYMGRKDAFEEICDILQSGEI